MSILDASCSSGRRRPALRALRASRAAGGVTLALSLLAGCPSRSEPPPDPPAVTGVVEDETGIPRAQVDEAAVAGWCDRAGLPTLPPAGAIDAVAYRRLLLAAEAAAEERTAGNVGRLAMHFDGAGRDAAALTLYEEAASLDSADPRWPHLAGVLLLDRGEASAAADRFRAAIDAASAANDDGGTDSVARLAEALEQAGDAANAREQWETYVAARPDEARGHAGLARTAVQAGRLEDAARHLADALARDPDARGLLLEHARVLTALGRDADARAASATAAAIDRDGADAPRDDVLLGMQREARTPGYLRNAIAFAMSQRRPDLVLPVASELAARRPREAQAWKSVCWAHVAAGRPREAAEAAGRALALDPAFAPGHEAIARAALVDGRPEVALAAADRALDLQPAFARAHVTRSLALSALGRDAEALASADDAVVAAESDGDEAMRVDALVARLLAQVALGLDADARATATAILELRPDQELARRVLAGDAPGG